MEGLRANTKLSGGKCFSDCEVLPTGCISSPSSVPGPIVPDLRMSNLQKKFNFWGEKVLCMKLKKLMGSREHVM